MANQGDLREDLLDAFRWIDGHADVWRFFYDARLFARTTRALADPFRTAGVTKVAGIESRGFILGAAVARELAAGFVAIRKEGSLFPGEKVERRTPADYRGRELTLRIQRDSIQPGDRVVLADDWLETGWQAQTARALVEQCGGAFLGVTAIVDQLPRDRRAGIGQFHAVVNASELRPPGAAVLH